MDILILVLILGVLYWLARRENNRLVVSRYYVPADVSEELSIVQLSDLHCKRFGPNNEKLVEQIKQLAPDIIVITGDMIHKWDDKAASYVDALAVLK